MAENTIEKIQEKIRNYNSLNEENKTELLDLLAKLNNEIAELSKEQAEHAETIAGHIERSTDEAMKDEKDPNLLKKAIEGLSDSVKGFEVSHPILTENVNYIATVLSNMGI